MDFPVFHLDLLGNRMLIAVIAIIHVIMSHTMAVGGIPLITYLEWRGVKENDERWRQLAFRILFVFFIFTTSFGAMTGVGIWFSTSLVNPTAIGSLIRVFFWAWFIEWGAFVTEVILILCYYLTWKKWGATQKERHLKLGIWLSIASWITMALIVAILSFMMDIGSWMGSKDFWDAVLNPLYLPQLAFRTSWGMFLAGAAAITVVAFLKVEKDFKARALSLIAKWMLAWVIPVFMASLWYWDMVPVLMKSNVPTALLTQNFQHWYQGLLRMTWIGAGIIIAIAGTIVYRRGLIGRPLLILPYIIGLCLIAEFERVREFIRKPYAIADYLYANTVRKADLPLTKHEGVLKHANFARVRAITADNQIEAGREVFKLTCTRCHTVDQGGLNSIQDRLRDMAQDYPRDEEFHANMVYYIENIHVARPYMPPFPGNSLEAQALARYLAHIYKNPETLAGDQILGSKIKRGVTP